MKDKKSDSSNTAFIELLTELFQRTGESYREIARNTNLSHGALSKWMRGNSRPGRDACIVLAQHFKINPNEILQAAGYELLPVFDRIDPDQLSPEVRELAIKIQQISDLRIRRRLIEAIDVLISGYLPSTPDTREPETDTT